MTVAVATFAMVLGALLTVSSVTGGMIRGLDAELPAAIARPLTTSREGRAASLARDGDLATITIMDPFAMSGMILSPRGSARAAPCSVLVGFDNVR